MPKRVTCGWCVFLLVCGMQGGAGNRAVGDETIRAKSPGGVHQVVVSIDDSGLVTYGAMYRDRIVLRPSRLGLRFDSQADFDSGFAVSQQQQRGQQGKLNSRLGERSSVDLECNELRMTLAQQATGRSLRIVFRVFDQAIAFRYEIPKQKKLEQYAITGELTEFRLPADATAYTEYGHEGEYVEKPIGEIRKGCELPLLVRANRSGLYHVILQADAFGYSRRFVHSTGPDGVLGVTLAGKVDARNAFVTPWHILSTAESAVKLIENNFLRDVLVEDRQPEHPWIVPGKVIRLVDLTTKAGMEGIDFAAENGLQYVEYDAGWYGGERDPKADATTPRPGLDVAAVCEYGKTKGVGVILYVNKIHLRLQSDQIFPVYRKWGVKGLKFGFVDGRSQRGIAEVHRWAREALRHEMIVDVHDNYRPTGVSQRLPNLLTQEGIRGNEWMPTSRHNTTLPFTRFVAGAGDYTFCYLSGRLKTTNAHQLALSVVCFSPLQFVYWYGRPHDYANSMGKEWFKVVPTTWDETRAISGNVGEHFAVARRRGPNWFLGAITNESARSLALPLKFLDGDVTYQATIYRDAAGKELDIQRQEVTAKTVIKQHLRANGGVAIVIRKKSPPTASDR